MTDIGDNRRGILSPEQAGALREQGLPPDPVVAVDGWSVWTGRDWAPVGANRWWLTPPYTRLMLPPGPYRFYRCRDLIVGAESPHDASTWWSISQSWVHRGGCYYSGLPPGPLPLGDPGSLFHVVSAALRFDENDLAHNRRGASRRGREAEPW